ncbi:MAG TPA: hypothetical protein VNH63_07825 [Gemmatimonadales bacterium]|nr:hypothetical protein [Gemmatimonadales bacterium]
MVRRLTLLAVAAIAAACSNPTGVGALSGQYTVTGIRSTGDTLFSGALDLTQTFGGVRGSADLRWYPSGTRTGPLEGRVAGDSVSLNLEPGNHVDVWFLLNGVLTPDGFTGTWNIGNANYGTGTFTAHRS